MTFIFPERKTSATTKIVQVLDPDGRTVLGVVDRLGIDGTIYVRLLDSGKELEFKPERPQL